MTPGTEIAKYPQIPAKLAIAPGKPKFPLEDLFRRVVEDYQGYESARRVKVIR